jgi:hypothetical protein
MEWLENIKDTIAKRLKGAFGGTFIIVWSVLNWRLLFILLNFDNKSNLQERLLLIDEYWKTKNFCQIYIYPILTTILSVLVYSFLNYLTYIITSFFSLRIKPHILNIIDKSKVVERERFTTLDQQYSKLENKYNTEHDELIKTKNNLDELSGEKARLSTERNGFNDELVQTKKQLEENKVTIDEFKKNSFRYRTDIAPSDLFPGIWLKIFKGADNFKGSERFSISKNKYFINDKVYFEISSIKLNEEQNILELKKNSTIDNRLLVDRLIKVSDNLYFGIENEDIVIKYIRIDQLTEAEIDNLENSLSI